MRKCHWLSIVGHETEHSFKFVFELELLNIRIKSALKQKRSELKVKHPCSQTAWIHRNKADAEAGDEDGDDEDAYIKQYAAETVRWNTEVL